RAVPRARPGGTGRPTSAETDPTGAVVVGTADRLIASKATSWRRAVALSLLVGVLAAVPRLTQVVQPLTIDEPLWFQRSSLFAGALLAGESAGTYQTGHPGVTVMWLGTLGIGPAQADSLRGEPLNLLSASHAQAFERARLAMAMANSLLLVLIVVLTARVLDLTAATLAG